MNPFTPGDIDRFCFVSEYPCEPVHDHLWMCVCECLQEALWTLEISKTDPLGGFWDIPKPS